MKEGDRSQTAEDQRDIQACLAGDNSAYEALLSRYQDDVFRVALRLTSLPEAAEEVTQEAFVRAFHHLSAFRSAGSFKPWLLKIAGNLCRDFLRARVRDRRRSASLEEAENALPQWMEFEEEEGEESRARLRWALQELGPLERTLLIMKHVDGMSLEDMKASLGSFSVGTLKVRLYRARKKLAGLMRPANGRREHEETR